MKFTIQDMCRKATRTLQNILDTKDEELCSYMVSEDNTYQINLNLGSISSFYNQISFHVKANDEEDVKDSFIEALDHLHSDEFAYSDYEDFMGERTTEEEHEKIRNLLADLTDSLRKEV